MRSNIEVGDVIRVTENPEPGKELPCKEGEIGIIICVLAEQNLSSLPRSGPPVRRQVKVRFENSADAYLYRDEFQVIIPALYTEI